MSDRTSSDKTSFSSRASSAVSTSVLSSRSSTSSFSASASFSAPAASCGDGVLTPPEGCDDGNKIGGDGCSAACFIETGSCGDGIVQESLGEQCEPSTHDATLPYFCTSACRFFSRYCGDEVLQEGEECDAGSFNANTPDALCRLDCSLPRCGDNIIDRGEACDDGNRLGGDGCDAQCQDERQAETTPLPGSIIDLPFLRPGQSVPLPGNGIPTYVPPGSEVPQTGPEFIAIISAGAAAGYAWVRRRRM